MHNRISAFFVATLIGTSLVAAGLVACSADVDDDATLGSEEQAVNAPPTDLADASPPTVEVRPVRCLCTGLDHRYACSGRLSGAFHGFEPSLEFDGRALPLGPHNEYSFVVDHSGSLVATIGHEGFGAISSIDIPRRSCAGQGSGDPVFE